MGSHAQIYRLAHALLDCFGLQAVECADDMLHCRLEEDDMKAAGDWLAIGEAIEDLARLDAGETRH
jgi:hypothetical protein